MNDENKIIVYFIILLFIPFIIFLPLEFIWADDPFQKIILAPLGEEPFKLLIATFFSYSFFKAFKVFNKNWSFYFNFLYTFVVFSMVTGFIFGFSEGYVGNILLHISSSSMGAILILYVYLKVKNKSWKNRYKIASMFVTLVIPMFIHSLSNQFLNISYANHYPSFNYLVIIGRFLSDNTFINNAFSFSILVFIIAILLVIIWHIYLIYQQRKLQQF